MVVRPIMLTSNSEYSQGFTDGARALIWLLVFLSPTGYVLLLWMISAWQLPPPPAELILFLFCAIPMVALLVCGTMVWRLQMTFWWRVAGMVAFVLAMLVQCGIWLLILISVIASAL